MAAPQKLTDAQIKVAREIVEKRRQLLKLVSLYPSIARLAAEFGCSERYLQKILAGTERIGNALSQDQ